MAIGTKGQPVRNEFSNSHHIWRLPDKLEMITHWCKMGATRVQLADKMGVSYQTLMRWLRIYPEVKKAVEDGVVDADEEINNALHRRAKGFWFDEVTNVERSDGSMEHKVVKKFIPGDPSLLKYWQTVRGGEEWNERRIIEANINMDLSVNEYTLHQTISEIIKILKNKGLEVSDVEQCVELIETGTDTDGT